MATSGRSNPIGYGLVAVPSPRGLRPPKLKYETLHISEVFIKFQNVNPPCTNGNPPFEDFLATILAYAPNQIIYIPSALKICQLATLLGSRLAVTQLCCRMRAKSESSQPWLFESIVTQPRVKPQAAADCGRSAPKSHWDSWLLALRTLVILMSFRNCLAAVGIWQIVNRNYYHPLTLDIS